jgi:hypothetical protein
VLQCNKQELDTYCDFIAQKERVFRELVPEPADHYIDLFWSRLLPWVSVVRPGQKVDYRLLLRNNLERPVRYDARLLTPSGWDTSPEFQSLSLEAGQRGELQLSAIAPPDGDNTRRLLTAEIRIDGQSQGPISEALVTVTIDSDNQ